MKKMDWNAMLEKYGVEATIHNYHTFTDGTVKVKIEFVGNDEPVFYFADSKTFFKPLLKKQMKVIVNPKTKTLVYPNSETHPLFELPELPAEFDSFNFGPKVEVKA